MESSDLRRILRALASALCIMSVSGLAAAEPPARAARLGWIDGTVSFSPAGQPEWVQAAVNRPLTTGDRLWADSHARAEVQLGGTAVRLGPLTSVTLLNLDDRITQLQLSQGSLAIHVRSIAERQTLEVATPNLALTLSRAGHYRIEVDSNGDATTVSLDSGEAEVFGEGASYTVGSPGAYRFYGTGLKDYDILAARPEDDLDRWSRERDQRADNSPSARFVSTEVVGYEDLDANGTWRVDATYGNVWAPRRVASDWTPYRDGHWSWVDPWGWTWVDDAPWGYAVSHYGRWARIDGAWAWVPGPRQERAVYAPALVAFVGGGNFQVATSGGGSLPLSVGWFPLAPREVYRPAYPVSRGYFENINRSNSAIAPQQLNTVYNTTIINQTVVNNVTQIVYANQRVAGAVVAVPAQAFVQSQPVARAAVKLAPEVGASAPVLHFAGVAPVRQSVQGGAHEAATPPAGHERTVVARTAPPPPPVSFAAQQAQLAARPGTPIDEAQRTQLKPTAPTSAAPRFSVVATPASTRTIAIPPPTPASGRLPETRKADATAVSASRPAETRAMQPRAEVTNADAAQAETLQRAAATDTAARAAQVKAEALKLEAARIDAMKAAAAKAEAAKADAVKADAVKADAAKVEAAKAESVRANAVHAEGVRIEAARSAAVAKAKVAAPSPAANASGPRPNAEAKHDDEKKKEGRQP
jgi:hypothetical protein